MTTKGACDSHVKRKRAGGYNFVGMTADERGLQRDSVETTVRIDNKVQ